MKTFHIAALAVLLAIPAGLTTPVHAQQGIGTNLIPDTPSKTPDEIEREEALQRDYKEGLKKIPDGKASNDPWGSVRSAEQAPKSTAMKPAASKPKAPKAITPGKTATAKTPAAPQ